MLPQMPLFHSFLWMSTWCCYSVAKSCLTVWDPRNYSKPGFPVLHYLQEFAQSVIPSNRLNLCGPNFFLLPPIFPSIRVFFSESALCIRWPKYWSFRISLSNYYSGLISFRIDWFISLLSKRLSRVICTTIWKHQFFGTHSSLWSNSHIHTWLLEKP